MTNSNQSTKTQDEIDREYEEKNLKELNSLSEKQLLVRILKRNKRIQNNVVFFFWAYMITLILGFIAFMKVINN